MCNVTIITGTGRAGTSFLIGLMTYLGLPTGFTTQEVNETLFYTHAHAGLEIDPKYDNNQKLLSCTENNYIFKTPRFISTYNWLDALNLKTVIIPIRKDTHAARSREIQSKFTDRAGGWVEALSPNSTYKEQLDYNNHHLVNLICEISKHTKINTIFMSFPEHVHSSEYSFTKLKEILDEYNIKKHTFVKNHNLLSNKNLINYFN